MKIVPIDNKIIVKPMSKINAVATKESIPQKHNISEKIEMFENIFPSLIKKHLKSFFESWVVRDGISSSVSLLIYYCYDILLSQ